MPGISAGSELLKEPSAGKWVAEVGLTWRPGFPSFRQDQGKQSGQGLRCGKT